MQQQQQQADDVAIVYNARHICLLMTAIILTERGTPVSREVLKAPGTPSVTILGSENLGRAQTEIFGWVAAYVTMIITQ